MINTIKDWLHDLVDDWYNDDYDDKGDVFENKARELADDLNVPIGAAKRAMHRMWYMKNHLHPGEEWSEIEDIAEDLESLVGVGDDDAQKLGTANAVKRILNNARRMLEKGDSAITHGQATKTQPGVHDIVDALKKIGVPEKHAWRAARNERRRVLHPAPMDNDPRYRDDEIEELADYVVPNHPDKQKTLK